MDGPLASDLVPTVTRAELRQRKRGEEENKRAEVAKMLEQVTAVFFFNLHSPSFHNLSKIHIRSTSSKYKLY
jgi:hypothetical protein